MKPTNFAAFLTSYLTIYLPGHMNICSNTIHSYRDTFKLLLYFARDCKGIPPEKLTIAKIDSQFVLDFLQWLEEQRGNSISTRNQRLAAIHAFFKYVQTEEPSLILHAQRILQISFKKTEKPSISHLTAEELKALLLQPDINTKNGRRDLMILSLLYDTGARVSELADLKVKNVRLETPAIITLTGKGRKARHVPLMTNTLTLLKAYMAENKMLTNSEKLEHPLFYNQQRTKMTRAGFAYVLEKYAKLAQVEHPSIPDKVTPHMIRHTKAMHLLQAGVNLVYIRDILGHVNISTTEIYTRADSELKRKALAEVYPNFSTQGFGQWSHDKNLLDWLQEF